MNVRRRGMGGTILVPKFRCRLRIAVLEVMKLGARGSPGLQGSHMIQWVPERESTKCLRQNCSSTDIKFRCLLIKVVQVRWGDP